MKSTKIKKAISNMDGVIRGGGNYLKSRDQYRAMVDPEGIIPNLHKAARTTAAWGKYVSIDCCQI
jgi:hypothetical protein